MVSSTIAGSVQQAAEQLRNASDTPLLDAEILLANVLQVSRSYLFAFPERRLTAHEMHLFEKQIAERQQKIPIAYITGHREFWSLDLLVTTATLIPRPETELLVELALQNAPHQPQVVADLGTGSGAVALALASERPLWEIHATDNSEPALAIAKQNAARLKIVNIIFHQGNWAAALPDKLFDLVVSNPPYIALDDPNLTAQHEPKSALIANENGLADIALISQQVQNCLRPGGRLLLEHGFQQAMEVRGILANLGYNDIKTYRDLAGLDRVTTGIA